MIRWCAFCQKFLGEAAPFRDFRFTHGICTPCRERGVRLTNEAQEKLGHLVRTQQRLRTLGESRDLGAAKELISEALAGGLRPVDVLLGFLGPLFYELIEASPDHAPTSHLSSFCQELVDFSRANLPALAKQPAPDVLISTLPSTKSPFLLQLTELWLQGEGIHAQHLFPGLPPEELFRRCQENGYKAAVFFLESAAQAPELAQVAETIRSGMPLPPLLLAAGYPVKTREVGAAELSGLAVVDDDSKLFLTLKTHLALGFLYDLKSPAKKP